MGPQQTSKYMAITEESGNGGAKWQRRWRSKVAIVEKTSKYVVRAEQSGNGRAKGNGGANWQWRSKVAMAEQSGDAAAKWQVSC